MKIYLAGPMQGYPEFNYPAFHRAAKLLRDMGHFVFNPAEEADKLNGGVSLVAGNHTGNNEQVEQEHGISLRQILCVDMTWICQEAEAIALLPGWESSKGARAEHALATALGIKFHYLGPNVMYGQKISVFGTDMAAPAEIGDAQ